MAGAAQIKAGEAFYEVTAKDNTAAGLRSAQTRMAMFARAVAMIGSAAGAAATVVAAGVAAVVATVTAVITRSISTFLSVSEQMRRFSGIANPKAVGLTDAWGEFKAVISAVFFIIGDAVAGPLTQMLKVLTSITLQMAKFGATILSGGILNAFVTLSMAVQAVWGAMLIGMEAALVSTIQSVAKIIQSAAAALLAPLKALEGGLAKGLGVRIGAGVTNALSGIANVASAGLTSGMQADIAAKSAKLTALLAELSQAVNMGQGQGQDGGGLPHLGSSLGTFSSRGAGLLGVGPGGGMKTSDDETHKILERILKFIKELGGPVFK